MRKVTFDGKSLTQDRRTVFFTGTGALVAGTGVCWDRDYGTAATDTPERDNFVELPGINNVFDVAGFVAETYTANAAGQYIDIYMPKSVCPVYVTGTVTIGGYGGILAGSTAAALIGQVSHLGNPFMGRGTVKFLQSRSGAGLVMAYVLDGPESGLMEIVTTSVLTAGASAWTASPVGVTYIQGPATVASADVTVTLAAGTFIGQRKSYQLAGALTTNDFQVTLAGVKTDGTTSFTGAEFDADLDILNLEWSGAAAPGWRATNLAGVTLS